VKFTRREIHVVGLIANGMSNPEIAQALKVSVVTVKYHVKSILEKSGAKTRAHAVAIWMRQQISSGEGG
jgi:DNA-binding NarL/FixJ family response regulator